MDGLSAAASFIAVIQIIGTLASLCSQYLTAVKNAKHDIQRLQSELTSLKAVLEGAQRLLEGPNGAKLDTSQALRSTLDGFLSQLKGLAESLKEKLETVKKRHRLKWPFENKDVDNIIQTLHDFRDTLSASLHVDQTEFLLENFKRIGDEERLTILNWISSLPYRKYHNTVKEARTSDTCKWLLQDSRFCQWEEATSSMLLWLQGSPGTGKTFLTSRVIDHTENLLERSPNHEGLAFFYCNRNEEQRRSPLSVLQSYVRQLSTAVGNTAEMRKNLPDLRRETMLVGSELGIEACREHLLQSVNLYKRTTLILDALDECEPGSRNQLVEVIEFLLSKSKNTLKVFISSRPDGDIRDQFRSRPSIEVQATDNKADIEKYVNTEITKHRRWGKMSALLRRHIVQTILDRSDGMFQWTHLQIKQLLELLTEAAIRDRLGKLPIGLKATYNEMYSNIAVRNQQEKVIADRAFQLVMCAITPLSTHELLSAICLSPDPNNPDLSEKVDKDLLLDLSNNLLVLDTELEVWRFSHLSVVEYFEDNLWNLQQAHCHAGKICLRVLVERPTKKPQGSKTDSFYYWLSEYEDMHPLHYYSSLYWVAHIQGREGQETDPVLAGLLKAFLGSPWGSSSQYQRWYSRAQADLHDPYFLKPPSMFALDVMKEISPARTSLFIICRFSLYSLLSDWWNDAECPISLKNEQGDSLLSIAAVGGSTPICKALIMRGLDVNLPNGYYGSALAAAAAHGNIEIVNLLIKEGAEVNMQLQTGIYGNALAAAVEVHGNVEIVEMLIKHGAEVNLRLQTGIYGSALAAAVEVHGNVEIVEMLIKHGAEVNLRLQTGIYGSALAAAVKVHGNVEIVEMLIKHGAEVNLRLQVGEYGNALEAAVTVRGNVEIVEILIKYGARMNKNLQTGEYGRPRRNMEVQM